MNKKHLLGAISGFALATLLTSKLVFASCINYNLRAPKYGDEKSGRIVKQTTSAYGTNYPTKVKEVQMRFKTSMLTGHPCDLRGGLFPDGR